MPDEIEIEKFLSGPCDEARIEQYLAVNVDDATLQLAADLMAKGPAKTHADGVDDALRLKIESGAVAAKMRESILEEMNFETLLGLLFRIGHNFTTLGMDRHIADLDDRVRGPVLRMFERRVPGLPKEPPRQRELDIESALRRAKARTLVPFPEIPCDLESALRFAVDAGQVPWAILKKAFIDFWGTDLACEAESSALEQRIATNRNRLATSTGSDRATLKLQIRTDVGELKLQKAFVDHRRFFKPYKSAVPKPIARLLSSSTLWDKPGRVGSESVLADLTVGFYDFWQKHQKVYLNHGKSKSQKNKKSGRLGVVTKMGAIWTERTERFVQLCRGDVPRVDDLADSQPFRELLKAEGLRDPRTVKKTAGFFRTLLNHIHQPPAAEVNETIVDLLANEGVQAIDAETVAICLAKLRGHQAPS